MNQQKHYRIGDLVSPYGPLVSSPGAEGILNNSELHGHQSGMYPVPLVTRQG